MEGCNEIWIHPIKQFTEMPKISMTRQRVGKSIVYPRSETDFQQYQLVKNCKFMKKIQWLSLDTFLIQ